MKNIFTTLALLAILAGSTSCATILTGSKKKVTFDADIDQQATLTVDGYRYRNVTFPYTVKIAGGFDDTMVQAESEGYEKTQIVVGKKFNAVSVLSIFGLVPLAVDAASGAMMKPEYKFYEFEFQKEADTK